MSVKILGGLEFTVWITLAGCINPATANFEIEPAREIETKDHGSQVVRSGFIISGPCHDLQFLLPNTWQKELFLGL